MDSLGRVSITTSGRLLSIFVKCIRLTEFLSSVQKTRFHNWWQDKPGVFRANLFGWGKWVKSKIGKVGYKVFGPVRGFLDELLVLLGSCCFVVARWKVMAGLVSDIILGCTIIFWIFKVASRRNFLWIHSYLTLRGEGNLSIARIFEIFALPWFRQFSLQHSIFFLDSVPEKVCWIFV